MIKVTTKTKINFPSIDFTKDLIHVSKKIVVPLIKEGILTATDIEGNQFPRLRYATIKRKGHSRPLQETGKLLKSFRRKTLGKNRIAIQIVKKRKEIAKYLQVDGIGRAKKRFKFMGVTEGMERDANKYMSKQINKWVKHANR